MSVSNGQIANQTTFNNAFVSKTQTVPANNTVIGVIAMNNTTDLNSGIAFTNTQQYINEIADSDGTVGQGDASRKDYFTNNVVSDGDSRKIAINKIDAKFDGSTGHIHNGIPGEGPKISGNDLADFNLYFSERQTFSVTGAVGIDDDVSTQMSGQAPGGTPSSVGAVTVPPYNKVEIRETSSGGYVENPSGGARVFGRLTEAAGVWTLSYYTLVAAVETAYTMPSTNIDVFYVQVFNQDTRPTFGADAGYIASLDLTADIVDASAIQSGKVNTGAQSFGGLKTMTDGLAVDDSFALHRTDTASAATINNLPYKPFIKLTGVIATTLQGIASGADGTMVSIYNGTNQPLTITNEDVGAAATDRFHLPTGADMSIIADSAVEFIYDSVQQRWVIKSGAGGNPAGSNTEIQYNDAGSFGADPSFTFDVATKKFVVDAIFYDPAYTPSYWGIPLKVLMADSALVPSGSDAFIMGSTDVNTGAASAASADIGFQSGDNNNGASPTGKTGDMWLVTGLQNQPGASGDTGIVDFGTGYNAGSGNSGTMSFYTGVAASGSSGALSTETGSVGGANPSGNITSSSGASSSTGDSGDNFLLTGNSASGNTGDITIGTGVAGGNSGNVIIRSQTATGTRGNVITGGGLCYGVGSNVPAATFTLPSNESYYQLNPAGNVTSDATTAITAGRFPGQLLILHNISAFSITLKNNALTQLPNAIDHTLNANCTISFIWSGSIWVTTASSAN